MLDRGHGHAGYTASIRLAVWMFLLSPLILRAFKGTGYGLLDPLLLFNLGTSLLWMAALHFGTSRPGLLHALLLPLFLATGFDLFLQQSFGARLTSGYIGIALTDHAETPEFFRAYASTLVLPLGLAALVYLGGGILLKGAVTTPRKRLSLIAIGLLVLVYGAAAMRGVWAGNTVKTSLMDVAGKEMSAPMGPVFQGIVALQLHSDGAKARLSRSSFTFNARQVAPQTAPSLVVWVIGESSRPQNWSLFGYSRPTTPLLQARNDLITFPRMQTTAPHTAIAVPSMLSLTPITDWQGIMSTKSVVGAFSEAGYKTHWISAQEPDSWGGVIPAVAAEAGRRRYFERVFDGTLLGELNEIISSMQPGERHLVMLHTKGSHFEFSRRYPKDFSKFHTASGSRRTTLVDTYDNSILYTDWFLSRIIERLESHRQNTVLVYASDHGENLLDDDRGLFGHALGNEYDLPTAAFIWLSQGMQSLQPDAVSRAQGVSGQPVDLSYLPHAILSLSGIAAQGLDPTKNLFGREFVLPKSRPFIVRGELRNP